MFPQNQMPPLGGAPSYPQQQMPMVQQQQPMASPMPQALPQQPMAQAPAQSQLSLQQADPYGQANQAANRFQHLLQGMKTPVVGTGLQPGNNQVQQQGQPSQMPQGGFAPFANGFGMNSMPQGGGF